MDAMPWEDRCWITLKKSIMASSPWLAHRFTHTHNKSGLNWQKKTKISRSALAGNLTGVSLATNQSISIE